MEKTEVISKFHDFVQREIGKLYKELRRYIKQRSEVISVALEKCIDYRLRGEYAGDSFLNKFEDIYVAVLQRKTKIDGNSRMATFLLNYVKQKMEGK